MKSFEEGGFRRGKIERLGGRRSYERGSKKLQKIRPE